MQSILHWYISENIQQSFCIGEQTKKIVGDPQLEEFYEVLKAEIKKKTSDVEYKDFLLKFKFKDDLYLFRGNYFESIDGRFYSLRKISNRVPTLDELKLPSYLVEIVKSGKIKQGLVIVIGETGNGKSTTCASIIHHYCQQGAFALTVEDPPELPLHGFIGKGYCFQTEVKQNGFADAIRNAMRSYPQANNSILFVGEVRDAETAKELIKISANGHLVFATLHGGDIITGLKRLVSLANEGNSQEILSMLSSSFRLAIYQKMKNTLTSKEVFIDLLASNGATHHVGIALNSDLNNLQNALQRQEILLKRGTQYFLNEL